MKNRLQRLVMLLAAMDMTASEVEGIARELRAISPSEFAQLVDRVRDAIDGELSANEAAATIDAKSSDLTRSPMRLGARDAVTRIDNLLRKEAGMPVAEAWKVLAMALIDDGALSPRLAMPSNADPQSTAAFRKWLRTVVELVPPRVVLHHATSIRNKYVHRPPSDWPLRDRDANPS